MFVLLLLPNLNLTLELYCYVTCYLIDRLVKSQTLSVCVCLLFVALFVLVLLNISMLCSLVFYRQLIVATVRQISE